MYKEDRTHNMGNKAVYNNDPEQRS